MAERPILVISGTNRPQAYALLVARVIMGHYARQDAPAELLDLCDLPHEIFFPEAYRHKPAAFAPIQERILSAGALHIVTPEYNGSFPGALKYFIDMLKYPQSLEGRPVALVGESSGVYGAVRPVEQLQLILAYRNAHLYPRRVFIPAVAERFDADGRLTDAAIDQRLAEQAAGLRIFARAIRDLPRPPSL